MANVVTTIRLRNGTTVRVEHGADSLAERREFAQLAEAAKAIEGEGSQRRERAGTALDLPERLREIRLREEP